MSTSEANPEKRMRKISQEKPKMSETPRGTKTICLPITETDHKESFNDPVAYRKLINKYYEMHPELFPSKMEAQTQWLCLPSPLVT